MTDQISLTLHCRNLPGDHFDGKTAVRLGIQRGSEVVQDVPGSASQAPFSATLRVAWQPDGRPNFLGPFAFGTPQQRFLYLCWGERGQTWEGFRRAKISLGHLSRQMVESALQSGVPLQAALDMTDAKGGPLCGSVRAEQIEWHLA